MIQSHHIVASIHIFPSHLNIKFLLPNEDRLKSMLQNNINIWLADKCKISNDHFWQCSCIGVIILLQHFGVNSRRHLDITCNWDLIPNAIGESDLPPQKKHIQHTLN